MTDFLVSALHEPTLRRHITRVRLQHGRLPPAILAHPAHADNAKSLLRKLELSIPVQIHNGGVLAGEAWLEIPEEEVQSE